MPQPYSTKMKYVPKPLKQTADASKGDVSRRIYLKETASVLIFFVLAYFVLGWLGILLATIIIGGLLLSLFDGKSLAEGQYLAFITAMTIGYGDITSTTTPGRILSILAGVIGLIFFGIIVAVSNRALAETVKDALGEQEKKK